VITVAAMDEAGKSAWCREQGIYPAELDTWRSNAMSALAQPEEERASPQATRQDKKRSTYRLGYIQSVRSTAFLFRLPSTGSSDLCGGSSYRSWRRNYGKNPSPQSGVVRHKEGSTKTFARQLGTPISRPVASEQGIPWRRQPPVFNPSIHPFAVANRVRFFRSWLRRIAPELWLFLVYEGRGVS
jgi:hypothetical protein